MAAKITTKTPWWNGITGNTAIEDGPKIPPRGGSVLAEPVARPQTRPASKK